MALWLYNWLFFLLPLHGAGPTFSKPHTHPFYVGVVEVAHNKGTATLEISCKLFAEDVETTLEQTYKKGIDFGATQQKAAIDGLLTDYFSKNLALMADKKALSLHYLGFEQESESLYCYFEVSSIPAVKSILLRNSLLYDFTDKQINIMHVQVNGVRKSFKLDYPQTQATFEF
jgi:hypothetical protein